MKKRSKRQPARSWVVTIALGASACGGAHGEGGTSQPTMNPPPREPEVTEVIATNPPPREPVTVPTSGRNRLEPGESIARRRDECTKDVRVACPPQAPCNPPPPQATACPPELTASGVIVRLAEGSCTLRLDDCHEGPLASCNPPPPRVVPCTGSPGQMQGPNGSCLEFVAPHCPRPELICEPGEARPVACPTE